MPNSSVTGECPRDSVVEEQYAYFIVWAVIRSTALSTGGAPMEPAATAPLVYNVSHKHNITMLLPELIS